MDRWLNGVMTDLEGDTVGATTRIGGQSFLVGYACGLFMAALFIYFMSGTVPNVLFQFILEWPIQFLICLTVGPLVSWKLGKYAWTLAIDQQRSPWIVVPILGFASVWITVITFSMIGFFIEGLGNESFPSAVRQYLVNPLLLISAFGFPVILLISLAIAYLFHRHTRDLISQGGKE